jgi:TRAP-type mannitol/chloroaromatic compound transport system permease small subunit
VDKGESSFLTGVDKINAWVGKMVSYLLLVITFITAFEVIMRYIVKRPTIWAWDLNIQLFAALTMLGGGYTLLEKGHVQIDVLVSSLSPKKRAWIDILTAPFFFFGFFILLWLGWQVGWQSFVAREAMPTIWAPPYYIIKLLIPIGALLLLLQGATKFIRDLHTVSNGGAGGLL